LWNDPVKASGVSKERRDKALVGLRKLRFRRFRKVLLRDCSAYLASAYGADWERKPHQKRGGERTDWIATKEQSPLCCGILPTPIGLSSTQGQDWFIFVSWSDIGRKRGTESKFSSSGPVSVVGI
jgi:hypothetical protein